MLTGMNRAFEESRGAHRRSGIEVGDVDRMEREFKGFVDRADYSSVQIVEAYQRALRTDDEKAHESMTVAKEVTEIEDRMRQMIAACFLLNRFVKIIDTLQGIEAYLSPYEDLLGDKK